MSSWHSPSKSQKRQSPPESGLRLLQRLQRNRLWLRHHIAARYVRSPERERFAGPLAAPP